jgi:hypothetical protein
LLLHCLSLGQQSGHIAFRNHRAGLSGSRFSRAPAYAP